MCCCFDVISQLTLLFFCHNCNLKGQRPRVETGIRIGTRYKIDSLGGSLKVCSHCYISTDLGSVKSKI